MAHSTRRRKSRKPHKEFPLTQRRDGRWCKKVNGKIWYFGKDQEKALDLWLYQKDDILAGRKPRNPQTGAPAGIMTTDEVVNRFVGHKHDLLKAGELAERTYARYEATGKAIIAAFGRTRDAADLQPDDFRALRRHLAKSCGPVALANEITIVRGIFRFAVAERLLDAEPFYGHGFAKPSAMTLRKVHARKGPRMFTREQIAAALEHATPNMKAMILLGINCGMGNTDLALLPIGAVDLAGGWLDFPRPKTGIPRRAKLWPETVEAIRAALEARREPKEPADAPLLFIGRRGENYVGRHKGYRVNQEAARVFKNGGVQGRSFYDLRRTFQTVGEEARDLVAVQSIMGHAPPAGDMSARYRQKPPSDDRLEAVAAHVRAWLFPPKPKAKAKRRKAAG